jgi:hypothetical protein
MIDASTSCYSQSKKCSRFSSVMISIYIIHIDVYYINFYLSQIIGELFISGFCK